jgi:signal transduction histidine kinase
MGPLTTLSSMLEMIAFDAEQNLTVLPPDVLAMVRQGGEITTRLEQLTTDVLGYYRLITPPRLVPVDLDALVVEAIASLPTSSWHDALVEKDVVPPTIGDPTRLRLLFRQLFDNARTRRGPGPLAIHIAATEYDDAIRMSLTDNGIGVKLDDDCVDPLDTPAEAIGLGMALCKRIVEQHGGRMWLESGRRTGMTVHLTLPRAAALPRAASR